ncbi:response regulator transcription factor [Cytophagales bacterium LB-30]|uniref:Response regulator transcription factor n=1 Tax=Shiella aurantiaca TaxID=3058365 RepID=A0ABT8F269_9BACT|nr:response regulator transcription factor [Shiella aurantiaca]MDN4164449.1 response regulator transcription factor [Shiella aurantiaca]
MPISIAIAEDNSIALSALRERLKNYPELVVEFTASHGRQLLAQLKKQPNIDLVLMDIEMPELNGVETTREIKTKYPQIKVLMLTMFDDEELLFNAIMAGASGYLLKEDSAVQIFQAITDTMAGGAAMSPGIAMKTLRLVRQPLAKDTKTEDFGLTDRETELLMQLKNGLTYEEIASNLHISYHTVRKHIENIYRKMQVNNKVEAIQKASHNRLM